MIDIIYLQGNGCENKYNIRTVNQLQKRVSSSFLRWWNRCSAIKMDRNQLRGKWGSELNMVFTATEFNLQKQLRTFPLFLYSFGELVFFQCEKRIQKVLSSKDLSYSR